MPYRYNPFTGNLDFYDDASSGGGTTDFDTDAGMAAPSGGTITLTGGPGINTEGAASVVTINLDIPVEVPSGGTGRTSIAQGTILLGDGSNRVELVGPLLDGQLLIGDTAGVFPVAASLTQPAAGITITGGAGSITFALADDLLGIESLSTTGLATRSSTSTWVTRSLIQPAAGITISNETAVSGNPTFALADDLAALEGLATAGMAARTGASTWTTRTIAGTSNRLDVTNGDGVSGNPTLDISASYVGQATITTLGTITTGTWNGNTIAVANGGTGATTLGDGFVLLGSGTGAITALDVTAKGSLLVGDGTTDPQALPVGTDGFVLTANSGTATGLEWAAASAGGGLTWNEETGTSASAAVNNGYITNNAALVTVTIPTTAAVGDIVRVVGKGAGGWRIAQNASEVIHFLGTNTTTGTGGRLDSTNQYDAVELLCTVANTEWTVISSMGNITIT